MNSTSDQTLIASFSDDEKEIFQNLLSRLTELKGNIEDLSPTEKQQLLELAKNHQDALSESGFDFLSQDFENVSADVSSAAETVSVSDIKEFAETIESEFANYVLENINESLCQGGASTADAIRYAFHNKWLPENLKNRDICEELFYRFYDDIEKLNENIQQHASSSDNMDTVVAIGLAWFTIVFQLYHLVETEGDV